VKEIDTVQLNIKAKPDELSEIVINNAGEYRKYDDEDLFNATEIFMEILLAKMYEKHKNKLTHP